MKNMKMSKQKIYDICLIGLFTALIAVFSQISIPLPSNIPMTLQTFIIPLTGVILGPKKGTIASFAYIFLGALGIPVFTAFTGGMGIVLGVTGGYILGFPLMAFLAGYGVKKGGVIWTVTGITLAVIADYACGLLMYMILTGSSLKTGLTLCVLPYIPMEAVKALMVGVIGVRCRKALLKSGIIKI